MGLYSSRYGRSPAPAPTVVADPLAEQLRSLGLAVMAERYQELADAALQAKSPYPQYLAALTQAQLTAQWDRALEGRLRRARFPSVKTLEAFSFAFQPGLNETHVRTLADLHFLDRAENVLLVGPPGVGKTHLAIALGIKACAAQRRVLFASVGELLEQLVQAEAAGLLPRKLVELCRLDLLILDELGYLSLDRRRANLCFQVVSRFYERKSLILTTNRRFEDWAELFAGDQVIAGAILDRLLHHRHLLAINGPSYRTPDLTGGTTTTS